MKNFPKGAEGLIIVGKTTSSRKLGGGIDKGIGLGGDGPSPTLSYLQGRSDRGCVGVAPQLLELQKIQVKLSHCIVKIR